MSNISSLQVAKNLIKQASDVNFHNIEKSDIGISVNVSEQETNSLKHMSSNNEAPVKKEVISQDLNKLNTSNSNLGVHFDVLA